MEYPETSLSDGIIRSGGSYLELSDGEKHNKFWGVIPVYEHALTKPRTYMTFWGRIGRTPQDFKIGLGSGQAIQKRQEKISKGYQSKSDHVLFDVWGNFTPFFVQKANIPLEQLDVAVDMTFPEYSWRLMLKNNMREMLQLSAGIPELMAGDQLLEALARI